MKPRCHCLIIILAAVLMNPTETVAQHSAPAVASVAADYTHVVNSFSFEVSAPISRVSPLFAPQAERSWAGEHWDPVFLYPRPGRDVPGAVWTVSHGAHKSIWINTRFDVAGGTLQYVEVIGEQIIVCVDVRVRGAGSVTHRSRGYLRAYGA